MKNLIKDIELAKILGGGDDIPGPQEPQPTLPITPLPMDLSVPMPPMVIVIDNSILK